MQHSLFLILVVVICSLLSIKYLSWLTVLSSMSVQNPLYHWTPCLPPIRRLRSSWSGNLPTIPTGTSPTTWSSTSASLRPASSTSLITARKVRRCWFLAFWLKRVFFYDFAWWLMSLQRFLVLFFIDIRYWMGRHVTHYYALCFNDLAKCTVTAPAGLCGQELTGDVVSSNILMMTKLSSISSVLCQVFWKVRLSESLIET